MLIEAGLLTEGQLTEALVNQKKANLKLGQYLVREGVVSESQIIDLVSRQLNVPKYRPDKYPLEMDLSRLIPADAAQKYQAVPLDKKEYLITIAMTDPMDINAMDAIEVITNTEVEAVICSEQEFRQLFSAIYGHYSGLDDVMGDMEGIQYGQGESPDLRQEPTTATMEVEVDSLQDMAEEAPVVRLVNSILSQAVREGASDVHISPEKEYVQVRFRVDGKLQTVPAPPKAMFLPLVSRMKILANMDIAVSRIPQDGRFTLKIENKEINIRASTIPSIHGENLVLRLLDSSAGIYSLDLLGMAEDDRLKVESIINKPYGMILSSGPTGSGKSTSLYSILKRINQPDINIITVEDPVEYRMEGLRQLQLNRLAGMTFASGLRAILRQDPDVIMVGEIRDTETATIAVQAALTGHRVLSTVHTNDAAGAITRFLDMGIEPFLVSSVMLASMGQRLVRKVCPNCIESYTPPQRALELWGLDQVAGATFVRGRGCFQCSNTGYKGRVGLFEVLIIDDMVQDMILQRSSAQAITRAVHQAGKIRTLKEDAADKILRGLTTLEEATSAVMA